jgi:uridine monophosphate synthetase
VLLIDDLVTTGLSLKESAEAVRAEGGVVTDAMAFLDREEGGKQLLEKNGVKLYTLLRISEIADTLYEMGTLDEESYKTVKKQIKKK